MRFIYLDGIRGIAALFVLARHWEQLLGFNLQFNYLAVDIFFLLSGFVIAHAYDEKLRSGTLTPGNFMLVRLVRLYPVYALAIVVSLAVALWTRAPAVATPMEWSLSAILALMFLPSSVAGLDFLFPLNICFWSLFAELVLNILYAYTHRFLTVVRLVMIISISALMLVIIAIKTGTIDHGFRASIPSVAAGLLRASFGIGLGLLMYRRRDILTAIRWRLSPWTGVMLVVAVMLAPNLHGGDFAFELISVFLIFPAAITISSIAESVNGIPHRIMDALAISSYPVYLLHIPIGKLIGFHIGTTPEQAFTAALIVAALLVLLSLKIERYFDIPARKWLRTILMRQSVKA